MALAAARAERVPLNLSGAIRTFTLIANYAHEKHGGAICFSEPRAICNRAECQFGHTRPKIGAGANPADDFSTFFFLPVRVPV